MSLRNFWTQHKNPTTIVVTEYGTDGRVHWIIVGFMRNGIEYDNWRYTSCSLLPTDRITQWVGVRHGSPITCSDCLKRFGTR
jgi:hypothetical protein